MQSFKHVLCAAILLHGAAAYAYEPVHEAQGFTLGRSEFDPEIPVSLLSESASSVKFALWGIEDGLNTATDSSYQEWSNDHKTMQAGYGLTVKEGYKITSITVTGTFQGALDPAQWTMPGDANNHLSFAFQAGDLYQHGSASDVDGQSTFSLSTGPTALQGEFGLWFNGTSESSAASVWYYDEILNEQYWLGSQATAGVSNLVLTINVAPVPEPGTWAMLVVGMAALGGAARLRRRHGGAA